MKTLHAFGPLFKFSFRTALVPAFLHRAGIFRTTKLSTQPSGAALSRVQHRGDASNDDHYSSDN
jgi:hypothetical protein